MNSYDVYCEIFGTGGEIESKVLITGVNKAIAHKKALAWFREAFISEDEITKDTVGEIEHWFWEDSK